MLLDGIQPVEEFVPQHYLTEYPNFVDFIQLYFKFMYSKMSPDEVDIYLNDATWWKGSKTPPEPGTDEYSEFLIALSRLKDIKRPGLAGARLQKDILLTRETTHVLDLNNMGLTDIDGTPMQFNINQEKEVNIWLDNFGLTQNKYHDSRIGFGEIDYRRFIKLIRHLYTIRGSKKLIELFFSFFFPDSEIRVSYPRSKIAGLDNNMVLDGIHNLRDDRYYSEFSYEISIGGLNSLLTQVEIPLKLYKQLFHPAGFELFVTDNDKVLDKIVEQYSWLALKYVAHYEEIGFRRLPERIRLWPLDEQEIVQELLKELSEYAKMLLVELPKRFGATDLPSIQTMTNLMDQVAKYVEMGYIDLPTRIKV